ncbi:helix-turn-helix domain-containing protein [Bacillus sp. Marseille-P3661]|uniref:helix-turn-helix domain-containing protein n=1 Tax=Bacillus sp. Marseille-P3661 TaxID=1936234 RepID=UPI000C82407E|nr:helix-turn-helix domain-containing protein [Bacillus sp. Marseille-P3661]
MQITKREKLIKRIENHLRIRARQLVKFDTEEETLQYVVDSFRNELLCDFVGIILKEENYLVSKVSSGGSVHFTNSFPLLIENCNPDLLLKSLRFEGIDKDVDCQFSNLLFEEKISTWFTLPLKEGNSHFGFCVIGFTTAVPLFVEMGQIFIEFGKDIAVAVSLAKRKETQKNMIKGVEGLSQNLFIDSSIEKVVETVVERAGKGTYAKGACIYLIDERENCFILQSPAYGTVNQTEKILIDNDYVLKHHFPYLETPGGHQLSVPLVVNLKTIGVLHVENKRIGAFTNEDFEVLELLSTHVAAILENARLYKNEKDHKQQLHSLLEYQQKLIKETVEQENFDGITSALSKLLSKTVILFDRFMRPIAYELNKIKKPDLDYIVTYAAENVAEKNSYELEINIEGRPIQFRIWPVNGAGELLGYLAIKIPTGEFDEFHRLSIELSLNVYSVQFIKQKLVFDTKEQVKDSFINKLLVEKIENPESIIQYANLFNWDIQNEYRVSVLTILLDEQELANTNLLEQQAKKTLIWENLKTKLSIFDQDFIIANKGEEYIIFVPTVKEGSDTTKYWTKIYSYMKSWVKKESIPCNILLGIGGKTKDLNDYYNCYQQGVQTLNVVMHRFNKTGFAFFDNLGAYTLLYHLREKDVTALFINKHLKPLLQYKDQKSSDLFDTLRVFLQQNGSIKETADTLFIHRSTLQYRMEKIQSLLEVDIHDAEQRFNLMMAYKLYDLYYDYS